MTPLTELSIERLLDLALSPQIAAKLAAVTDLSSLRSARVAELTASYGLTTRAAKRCLAIVELGRRLAGHTLEPGMTFRCSRDIFSHAQRTGLIDLPFEQFHAFLLDGKHRLIEAILISQGTLTNSPVHPREVFSSAVRMRAASLVLCHNHPSGDPTPSADDLEVTRRLREVGDLLGVRVLDHVIVGRETFVSLADRGLL